MVLIRYCKPDTSVERGREKERLLREIHNTHGIETEVVDAVRSGYGAGSILLVESGKVVWKVTYDPSLEFLHRVLERGPEYLDSVASSGSDGSFHA